MGLREALDKLLARTDLSSDESSVALDEIVNGDVDPSLIAAFLVALRMKGETADEIAGLARTMRDNAVPVRPKATGLVDTCGTGGDGTGTANISTTAAFVVAGAGLPVAKHGNRAISSGSGSADVLEALGVPLDISADKIARCIDDAGIGFMFAPALHPAMAKVMPVRRALGIRTAFNILGPLTNPARPSYQLVGAGTPEIADLLAGALATLGIERAIVVHGAGGADELTCAGDCIAIFVEDGKVDRRTMCADDADLETNPLEALRGGTPQENAELLRATLEGKPGPIADCVLFNAGAALIAAGRVADIREGVDAARSVIDNGDASAALERLVAVASAV
jgi:anthranilate phosphoribosyltransferase